VLTPDLERPGIDQALHVASPRVELFARRGKWRNAWSYLDAGALGSGSMPTALLRLMALPLLVAGCHQTAAEVIKSQASLELPCSEDKIQVEPTDKNGNYRASGCGKKATYHCEGWDSANQQPICETSR
jgi:hypothetical protein